MLVLAVVVAIVAACILVLTALGIIVAAFIRVFRTTYCWAGKVLSDKSEDKLTKHVQYLVWVEQQVTPDMNSKCSKTPITDALKLLKGELEEELKKSLYIVHKWLKKTRQSKRRPSDDFIKNLERSKTTIELKLRLFLAAVDACREEEGNDAVPQTRKPQKSKEFEKQEKEKVREVEKRNHGKPQKSKEFEKQETEREVEKRNYGKPQKSKEFEKQEKEREVEKRNHGKPQKSKEFEKQEKEREVEKKYPGKPQRSKEFEKQEKEREVEKRNPGKPQKSKEFEKQEKKREMDKRNHGKPPKNKEFEKQI